MADKGYSHSFRVMLKHDGGIKIVTNALSMKILKLILARDMNLTEIANSLGVAKSTVQAGLSRLETDGLITSFQDEEDSRCVTYTINSAPIYTSYRFVSNPPGYAEAVDDICLFGHDIYSDAMVFYSTKLREYGICIHPFLLDIGNSIGVHVVDRVDSGNMREILEDVYGVTLGEFSIGDSVTFRIKSGEILGEALTFIGFVILGTIQMILYRRERVKIDREPKITSVSSHEYIFETVRTGSTQSRFEMKEPMQRDWKFYRVEDRFAVYCIDNGPSYMVQNEMMLDILAALEDGPRTVNELSAALDTRSVTIHASMSKMADVGFVEQVDSNETRNVRYRLRSKRVLGGDTDRSSFVPGTLDDILERFLGKEISLYRTIFDAQFFILTGAGVDYITVMKDIGADLAMQVIRSRPGITAEEFLDVVTFMSPEPDCDVILRSLIPVRLEVVKAESILNPEGVATYIRSIAETGLREITGSPYPVEVVAVDGEGKTGLLTKRRREETMKARTESLHDVSGE